jgi:hypothetical protein
MDYADKLGPGYYAYFIRSFIILVGSEKPPLTIEDMMKKPSSQPHNGSRVFLPRGMKEAQTSIYLESSKMLVFVLVPHLNRAQGMWQIMEKVKQKVDVKYSKEAKENAVAPVLVWEC